MSVERHKEAEVASRTPEVMAREARKPFGWSHGWGAECWLQWAAVTEMLHRLAIAPPATVLDVGCGPGWATAFLAEAGYRATGVDIVPANVEVARERAARWGLEEARFEVGDMDHLQLDNTWDAALLLDALHHSTRPADVLAGIARHLRPGGWLLLGEPSVLHRVSPHARHTSREAGWTERGISVRRLRRDLRSAGFAETRRFYGPTRPYEARWRGLLGQTARLLGANLAAAPQMHVWMAARRRP
jgi:SAM-dependent methyltransferase